MRPNDTSAPGHLLFLALSGVLVPHDRPSSAIDTKLTVPTLRLVTRVLGLPQIVGFTPNGDMTGSGVAQLSDIERA